MFRGFRPRSLIPSPASHRLRNHPLPAVHRQLGDTEADRISSDPLARDPALTLLEAALLIADEPLPTRKLVEAANLPDATAARRMLKKLQELYDADGSAFELEELAGGF